jgi:hypothetical protein
LGDFGWTILLAVVAAAAVFVIGEVAKLTKRVVAPRPFLLTTAAALAVGGLAIAFGEATGEPTDAVLFSGQEAFGSLFDSAAALPMSTLALLLLFKGIAWSVSLGNFRGGPTFPAIFLGVVGGLLAAHLPGFAETQAVAVLMGAACVSILRLPLSSVMIALLLTSSAGLAVAPLVIVAVVVAYIATEVLSARRASVAGTASPSSVVAPTTTAEPDPA